MTFPFEPGQVQLIPPTPLTDCFGRLEREVAAAMILRVLQRRGRGWGSVTPKDIGEMIHADAAEKTPELQIWSNPFCRPDAEDLVEKGFARWLGDPRRSPIEFTDVGIMKLRTCVSAHVWEMANLIHERTGEPKGGAFRMVLRTFKWCVQPKACRDCEYAGPEECIIRDLLLSDGESK